MSKHDFPQIVWQIWLTTPNGPDAATVKDEHKHLIQTWTEFNPHWTHIMIDEEYANDLIAEHFTAYPQIRRVFDRLQIPIFKADLLRLLVLYVHGGLYSDLDTECIRPVESWDLEELSNSTELVVGLEYDNFDKVERQGWSDDIQIATWTIMARAKSKRLLETLLLMIELVSHTMDVYVMAEQLFGEKDDDVLDTIGPRGFTRALLKVVSKSEGYQVAHAQLSMLDVPKNFGGVRFLPVTAFACEQPHSRSGRWNDPAVLVTHHYHHSWKKNVVHASCQHGRCKS
ncbi:hypothetical protein AA0111_g10859 [Alternaria arborescens]|uniref:hypothetical protein n=1 Tax=Alternaria arborescens TaxID=156630 RepID=UPI00107575CB|nr:hypothetical protein AA0111_g10859 [Alternaria arborescens]RYO18077.1 hypothetical protein AA0111_g10859 [Alternaria arborescens]